MLRSDAGYWVGLGLDVLERFVPAILWLWVVVTTATGICLCLSGVSVLDQQHVLSFAWAGEAFLSHDCQWNPQCCAVTYQIPAVVDEVRGW